MFSVRHGTLQINIHYINALLFEGFFFNKTTKEKIKVLFQSSESLGRHKPVQSADMATGKNHRQRNEIKPLFPHP